jgi:hypothetical protein
VAIDLWNYGQDGVLSADEEPTEDLWLRMGPEIKGWLRRLRNVDPDYFPAFRQTTALLTLTPVLGAQRIAWRGEAPKAWTEGSVVARSLPRCLRLVDP